RQQVVVREGGRREGQRAVERRPVLVHLPALARVGREEPQLRAAHRVEVVDDRVWTAAPEGRRVDQGKDRGEAVPQGDEGRDHQRAPVLAITDRVVLQQKARHLAV